MLQLSFHLHTISRQQQPWPCPLDNDPARNQEAKIDVKDNSNGEEEPEKGWNPSNVVSQQSSTHILGSNGVKFKFEFEHLFCRTLCWEDYETT